jgi:hypothetical protein
MWILSKYAVTNPLGNLLYRAAIFLAFPLSSMLRAAKGPKQKILALSKSKISSKVENTF